MKKTVLILSFFLTFFALGLVGGVLRLAAAPQSPAIDYQQTLAARDALYSQSIAEANARLEQANQQILAQQASATQPAVFTPALSADQATQIALQSVLPGAQAAAAPELVSYNGAPAYEVRLADQNIVYIDAQNGTVLYNPLTGSSGSIAGPQQAMEAVLAYAPGSVITAVELGSYNSQPAYQVSLRSGDRIFVDLRGQVVYVLKYQYTVQNTSPSTSVNQSSSSSSSNTTTSVTTSGETEREDEEEDDGD